MGVAFVQLYENPRKNAIFFCSEEIFMTLACTDPGCLALRIVADQGAAVSGQGQRVEDGQQCLVVGQQ